ncbi:MAG TPA: energy transducer TonB [Candidatus Didemnitutus sp.]|nr:energy transducer TonB [Candidatus Didemnitutus sp.]
MTPLRRFSVLILLGAALGLALPASADSKPGYNVLLEVSVNDKGVAEDAKIVKSEDISGDHILDQLAVDQVRTRKFDLHMKEGKAVPYKARVPFVFPIEGDEGADSNLAPRPALHGSTQVQPVYPPDLAAKGEVGAAIIEITVGAEGEIKYTKVLRATEKAFADAAETAVKQWHFAAAQQGGQAVSSRWRMAIIFQTEEREPVWEWRIAPRPALGSYTVMHVMHPEALKKSETPAPAAPAPAAPANPPAPGK